MANDKSQTQQKGQQPTKESSQQIQINRSKGPSGNPAVKK